MYAAKKQGENIVVVRRYNAEHRCFRSLTNKQANSNWLAKEFLQRFRRNHSYGVEEIALDIKEKYAIIVSK